ncbi:MAG: Asp-tRNA(Asn)/Glu-tRNA(Gln) amidotransferase subunit GatA [Candidatus Dadabacteria bacterium]
MFQFTSISEYHTQLKAGRTTCVEAVQYYISRIEENRHLNAFVEVYAEEALSKAAALDQQAVSGKLYGVIIGIKNNICYKGHHSAASSGILDGFSSVYSATAVDRLLEEGAIIIGSQNCDEFGMGSTNENSFYGSVLNPSNIEYVPGGSSGGSAAAVKAGLCMASLGSDTGGSVRLPADFCGVIGLKPAYGTISRYGLIAYASSFDQIGILANTIEDTTIILKVIEGADEFDSTVSSESLVREEQKKQQYRIGYFPEWINHSSLDPQISTSISNTLNNLKKEGHNVEAVSFPLTEYIVPTYYILTTAEASSNLARYDGARFGKSAGHAKDLASFYQNNRHEFFGNEVKRRIMLGSFILSAGYYDAYFTKAQQVRSLLIQQTELIFSKFDFIIAPTSPTPAYKLGEKTTDPVAMYMGDIFTVFANLTGLPAISLPLFKHNSNLPFGLQLLSSHQNVVSLLRFSQHLLQQ